MANCIWMIRWCVGSRERCKRRLRNELAADDLPEASRHEAVPELPLLAVQRHARRPRERLLRAVAVVVVGDDHVEAEGEALLRAARGVDVGLVLDERAPGD